MSSAQDLVSLIRKQGRKILVSLNQIDLSSLDKPNIIFLFEFEDSLAAGGRSGGYGERRPTSIYCFVCKDGLCSLIFRNDKPEIITKFDLPASVTRLPVILPDGTVEMVHGSIDPETVNLFSEIMIKLI